MDRDRQGRHAWCNVEHVEWEALTYVDWFNNRRPHGEIRVVPPSEFEAGYYELNESETLDVLEKFVSSQNPG